MLHALLGNTLPFQLPSILTPNTKNDVAVPLQVYAQAYDNPIPGYKTSTVGNLRLFEALPVAEFDLDAFNEGAYDKAILEKRKAEDISAVLYPNDATEYGKELRLKQQIFFVSASIQVGYCQ